VVTDASRLVVELGNRNLGTGGPRGLGQTGTERGPTVDQSTSQVHGLFGIGRWSCSVDRRPRASSRQGGGRSLLSNNTAG